MLGFWCRQKSPERLGFNYILVDNDIHQLVNPNHETRVVCQHQHTKTENHSSVLMILNKIEYSNFHVIRQK